MDDHAKDHDPSADGPGLFPELGGDEGGYRVLARKYRPSRFEDLIGQEALVRTLRNAFASGRIHHAFMLTGVRGVGKTTTARIIARALNYEPTETEAGPAGPTTDLAKPGVHCAAIAESRHPDVMEMDAASRTGINDIRELIEGVRYAPVSARYKVYIVDEVHMLSTQAFNGLLKTLEEPPPHVVFIFATTEIRKVPVTVLSRCQRFDLRRVDPPTLVAHLGKIAQTEGADCEEAALALIARAAEGSVRDALSLLDQAIAQGDGRIESDAVREMIGLADRARTVQLFELLLSGRITETLGEFAEQVRGGAEPLAVMQDLASVTHEVTKAKLASGSGELAGPDQPKLDDLAKSLNMPHLARAWQMLLKGISEVQAAPDPFAAAEMALIRLSYLSDIPGPEEIVRSLTEVPASGKAGQSAQAAPASPAPQNNRTSQVSQPPRASGGSSAALPAPAPNEIPAAAPTVLNDFESVVAMAEDKGELRLARDLKEEVRVVRFEPGHIEFSPTQTAPQDLAARLTKALGLWTGERWVVSLSSAQGAPTVRDQRLEAERQRRAEVAKDPLVKAILDTFPGAHIAEIRDRDEDAPAPDGADDLEGGEDDG